MFVSLNSNSFKLTKPIKGEILIIKLRKSFFAEKLLVFELPKILEDFLGLSGIIGSSMPIFCFFQNREANFIFSKSSAAIAANLEFSLSNKELHCGLNLTSSIYFESFFRLLLLTNFVGRYRLLG